MHREYRLNTKGRDFVVGGIHETYHGRTVVPEPVKIGSANFIGTGAIFNGRLTVIRNLVDSHV